MTPEERIAELKTNCKTMTDEIEKLKAELAEKVWQPKIFDKYMYIDSFGDVCDTISDLDNITLEDNRANFNNVYHSNNTTRDHLKWYRDNVLRVQNKLMQLHELLCPDYFPDWWDEDEYKLLVCYDNVSKRFICTQCYMYSYLVVYFTEEAAKKACEILNREKFMMEDISENK